MDFSLNSFSWIFESYENYLLYLYIKPKLQLAIRLESCTIIDYECTHI